MPASSSSADKRILITGGAGFIGSHLVDAYLADGWQVAVIDDLSTGNKDNLAGSAVQFFEDSILDRHALVNIFHQFRPTHISHHAAQVSVRRSLEDPAHDAKINVEGTLNLLELAQQHEVKQFVFASSGGAIYGENTAHQPSTEEALPKPVSPYAIAKLSAEHYLNFFNQQHGLTTTILRYANVFGPRQDPRGEAGVISIFLDCFAANKPAAIYGSGEQVRDFVYVGDVVAANLKATEKGLTGCFNIASGQVTSVNQLAELLVQEWQQKTGQAPALPSHADPVEGEILWSELSIAKAQTELGWQPQTSREAGLKQTTTWFWQHSPSNSGENQV